MFEKRTSPLFFLRDFYLTKNLYNGNINLEYNYCFTTLIKEEKYEKNNYV